MKHYILMALVMFCVTACAGKPPIKKSCSQIGETSSGDKLFEGCKDL